MTQIRRLTTAGIAAARHFLAEVRSDPSMPLTVPNELLFGDRLSQAVRDAPELRQRSFASRRAAAVHLDATLGSFGSLVVDDAAVWSWLGMFYFPQTVPMVDGVAKPSPRDEAFVIHSGESRSLQRRYVHYLWSAWRLYRQHGEGAAYLLDAPLQDQGDIADRVFSNARVFNSVGVVPLIMTLYTHNGRRKRGSGNGPGGLRHLMRVLNQRERTHDVYGMSAEELASLLPADFDRWKSGG